MEVGTESRWIKQMGADFYNRMSQTMKKLQSMREEEYSSFVRVMFGLSSVSTVSENLTDQDVGEEKLEWIDPSLNDSQKDAIRFALASKEIALIHGPPGVSHFSMKPRISYTDNHRPAKPIH